MKDNRIKCPFCKIRTWSNNYKAFMKDHDRPDGKMCRAAMKAVEEKKSLIANSGT